MSGSVILAGILLKLGGYGFIKYGLTLFPQEFMILCSKFKLICLLSIFLGSICTCVQVDIKRLIAYSSVVHMSMCIYPIFNNPESYGVNACVVGMIAHGFTSPGLFLVVGFLYERTNSRNIIYYGGFSHTLPVFSGIALVIILASMGVPGSINFIGEVFMLLNTVSSVGVIQCLLVTFGMFTTLIYSLKLYTYIFTGLPIEVGEFSSPSGETGQTNSYDLTLREAISLSLCSIPVFIFGLHLPG